MNPIRPFVCLAAVFAVAVFFSGCATVTRGTKDVLVIETDPPGATVTVDGKTATTPTSFKLSRKFEGTVEIRREGYEPVTVQVNSSPSTAGGTGMAGNVLVGGLIGMGVDAGFGSTNDLEPNPIKVSLVPIRLAPVAPNPELAALVQQQEAAARAQTAADQELAEAEKSKAEAEKAKSEAEAAQAAATAANEMPPSEAAASSTP